MQEQKNTNSPEIVIRSEEDAYEILRRASLGEEIQYSAIRFDGWPTLNLYLKGDKFQQSITPRVMKGLLELQRGIYRSYTSAKFGSPTKRLTDEEKDSLEIKVTVKDGSSSFDINFQEIAIKLIQQLGERMDPTQVLYTVVAIAAMYFGTSAYKSYLQNRKEIRSQDISNERDRQLVDSLKFGSEQETKRTQIIAELAAKDHRIDNISRYAHDAQTEVIKSLIAGSEAKIDGIPMPSPEVTELLTQNARRRSSEVRLDGTYRLLKLDWSDPKRFKVKVVNVDNELYLDAEVQDDSLTGAYKEALKNAEWSRKPISLKINAKVVIDKKSEPEYRDAVIISAELV